MKSILLIFALAYLCPLFSYAQQVDYNDVGVIVNDNSVASVAIGNYFASKRNIPARNIVHISCTDSFEINPSTFQLIRKQIELKLDSAGIKDSLNYLVLTKGVPVKIVVGNCTDNFGYCSSVDNELTLLFSLQSNEIGEPGSAFNPYYYSKKRYDRDTFGIYLVTRLDGYTVDDVKNLIDRSGFGKLFNMKSDEFIFTLNPAPGWGENENQIFTHNCYDTLLSKGFNATRNTDSIEINNRQRVSAYTYAWNSTQAGTPITMNWSEGSIAYVPIHFLDNNNPPYFRKNLFTLINQGVTGGYQPTSLTISNDLPTQPFWFGQYLRTDSQKVFFADAFYASIASLSVTHVLIGDPKATMNNSITAGISEKAEPNNSYKLYPNPTTGNVFIQWMSQADQPEDIVVLDQTGRLVYHLSTNQLHEKTMLNLNTLQDGLYLIQMRTKDRISTQKILLQK